jgi:hypothetical protein
MYRLVANIYIYILFERPYDRTIALQKMQQAGGTLTTATSMVLELMQTAEHADFKAISNIIKATRSDEFKDQLTI